MSTDPRIPIRVRMVEAHYRRPSPLRGDRLYHVFVGDFFNFGLEVDNDHHSEWKGLLEAPCCGEGLGLSEQLREIACDSCGRTIPWAAPAHLIRDSAALSALDTFWDEDAFVLHFPSPGSTFLEKVVSLNPLGADPVSAILFVNALEMLLMELLAKQGSFHAADLEWEVVDEWFLFASGEKSVDFIDPRHRLGRNFV